jgi:tetratricopeptide (TPR) repeat protein
MADIGVKNPGFFSFDQYLDPLRVYQRIIEKYPTTDLAEEALFKQGFAFSKQKKYQEAIATLMTVLEEYPDSDLSRKCFFSLQENLYKLVDSYFSEEKYYAILGLYQKYENPFLVETKNTKTLFQTGESFRQGGLYDKALELYGKARRIYPRSYPEDELILRMGEVYLLKKEYAKAERLFEKLIKDFPESRYRKLVFHNLADTYYEQESYNEARLAYLTALEGEQRIPRDIRGFFYLGKCYQALGNVSLTIDAYRNAIRVAEHLGEVGEDQGEQGFVIKSYFQLADCLYQNRKYLEAIKVYTQAVERYSEDDRVQWALYRIAESYRKVGKGKADIESLKKVASKGEREAFWEKVISENIRNLEWEVKNREHLVP